MMAGKSGVSLNWGGFDKAIGNAMKKMSDKRELMASIGEALVSGTIQRFKDEKSPDGKPWKKSRRAILQGGQTLADHAGLRSSIDFAATPKKVMVGSNVKYSRIHQFGGEIKPKSKKALKFRAADGNWVVVKKVSMPARPYLGISRDDMIEVRQTISDFLAGAFK